MNAADFHDLISGRRRGLLAAALRGLLAVAEVPYAIAVRIRNWRYDRNSDATTQVEVPVISVGNLTVGGTGKTPMVKWLARRIREQGVRVAILSRGYGAEAGGKNDEALELEQALPDVPHLQNPDRTAAARAAIEELESQALLLDDGFQHRRLGRDLDIVLLDATAPFGYGHLLPRGALRESIAGLRRAGVVCLTRAGSISASDRAGIRDRVSRYAPAAVWCEATHEPHTLLSATGGEQPLENLHGRSIAAFCGIGNPAAFRHTLLEAGGEIVYWREFPDHHNYTASDIANLEQAIGESQADLVVCTHKDLVKVQTESLAERPLLAVVVEIEFLAGEAELYAELDKIMQAEPTRPNEQLKP